MAVSFGRDQLPRLDAVAARKRVSRSALVRAAVEALLGRYEADHGDEQRAAAGALDAIRGALDVLLEPGTVRELRVFETERGTVSGYYDDEGREALVREAATWSGRAPGVYVIPNPVHRDLLARAVNRVRYYVKRGGATGEVGIL